MVRLKDASLRSLVDIDHGMISREVYTNEDIYRQELEQIFMRAWLFVGHESMVPKPGDFAASRMGAEEVLLVRDQKGKVHVYLNTCRHRGMKVCRYDQGNALVFTCPFHAWTYDTEGRLVGVGHQKEAYGADFDKSQWGLHEGAALQLLRFDLGHVGQAGAALRRIPGPHRRQRPPLLPELGRRR